jgi:hypothetical protein
VICNQSAIDRFGQKARSSDLDAKNGRRLDDQRAAPASPVVVWLIVNQIGQSDESKGMNMLELN